MTELRFKYHHHRQLAQKRVIQESLGFCILGVDSGYHWHLDY